MTLPLEREIHSKNKVICKKCRSDNLEFITILEDNEKRMTGKFLTILEGAYTKKKWRSHYKCNNCGQVTSYPVNEA